MKTCAEVSDDIKEKFILRSYFPSVQNYNLFLLSVMQRNCWFLPTSDDSLCAVLILTMSHAYWSNIERSKADVHGPENQQQIQVPKKCK